MVISSLKCQQGQLWLKWPRLLVVHRVRYSERLQGGNEERKKEIISKASLMFGALMTVGVSADNAALLVEVYQQRRNIVSVRLKGTEKR